MVRLLACLRGKRSVQQPRMVSFTMCLSPPSGSLTPGGQRERNATHWPVSAGKSLRRAKGTIPGSLCS